MQSFSLNESFWMEEGYDVRDVNKIMEEFGVSYILARLLVLVPKLKYAEIDNFLQPKVKNLMPSPFLLKDMQKAVERLAFAVENHEKITIFGDYDVDGATSSAVIHNYLKSLGIKSEIYIPDRVLEGYGPNVEAMKLIAQNGTKVLITVDCGTVAFEPLEVAHKMGMDSIVIDHHLGIKEIPKSVAVVNPNRLDDETDLKYLCGAGVSFMLVVALNSFLREKSFFANKTEPNVLNLLPLVAMGTVCDVMPLKELNRAFVKTGLQVLEKWQNVGLHALKQVAGVEKPEEYTFGFVFGPCINAGGRIGEASLGARLLTTESDSEAIEIAKKLFALNQERRKIEGKMKEEALNGLESVDFSKGGYIFVGGEGYHQGVIGIVASRLKDKFNKPAFVYSKLETTIKASARSIIGIDVGVIINKAVKSGLLLAGGGHEMAGGFTCEIAKIEELRAFFDAEILEKSKKLTRYKITQYACNLEFSSITHETFCEIEKLRPFGQGNFKPVFRFSNLQLSFWKQRGKTHIFFMFVDENGMSIKGICFGFLENHNYSTLSKMQNRSFDILAEITLNNWNNANSLELNIKDILIL